MCIGGSQKEGDYLQQTGSSLGVHGVKLAKACCRGPGGNQQPRIEPLHAGHFPMATGEKETPEEGLEPSTTRLRALRSTD